jgi:hypothetical protein
MKYVPKKFLQVHIKTVSTPLNIQLKHLSILILKTKTFWKYNFNFQLQ